jgi:hypothetical protein
MLHGDLERLPDVEIQLRDGHGANESLAEHDAIRWVDFHSGTVRK